MRILIVTPGSDLSVSAELVAAASNNQPVVLGGIVTAREVLRHISSGDYDAIHIGSHGDENSLQMSDGELHDSDIEFAFEAAAARGKPVRIVLLNSCDSVAAAARLHRMGVGGPGYVIGWAYTVPDDVAQVFAVNFWRNLHDSSDVHQVFDAAVRSSRSEIPDFVAPVLINGIRAVVQELTREVKGLRQINDGLHEKAIDARMYDRVSLAILVMIASGVFAMVLRLLQ